MSLIRERQKQRDTYINKERQRQRDRGGEEGLLEKVLNIVLILSCLFFLICFSLCCNFFSKNPPVQCISLKSLFMKNLHHSTITFEPPDMVSPTYLCTWVFFGVFDLFVLFCFCVSVFIQFLNVKYSLSVLLKEFSWFFMLPLTFPK